MPDRKLYVVEVRHDGLKKVRLIRGTNQQDVEQQASIQYASWDQMWKRRQADIERHIAPANRKKEAENRTQAIRDGLAQIHGLLKAALDKPQALDWEELKDRSEFLTPMPSMGAKPDIPPEPKKYEDEYRPNLDFLDRFLAKRRFKKIEQAAQRFRCAHREWDIGRKELLSQEREKVQEYEVKLKTWARENRRFMLEREARNTALECKREAYLKRHPDGIVDYFQIVLSRSVYPEWFVHFFSLGFDDDTKSLSVTFRLPGLADLPKTKEAVYDPIKNQIKDISLTETELVDLYEDVLCQVALRTFYEIFESDVVGAVGQAHFNGWISSSDLPEQGGEKELIVSVGTDRDTFYALDMLATDPRGCFVQLGGKLTLPASLKFSAADYAEPR